VAKVSEIAVTAAMPEANLNSLFDFLKDLSDGM
jgi:hypothetical protein